MSGKTQVHPLATSNSLPPIYTEPLNDKEIDVFTCLECNQVFWNRKTTLEHIYKEHARGALTYKARYMVKRLKNSKAYNSRKQIICMLCYFLFPNSDIDSYLEHLTGHYMTLHKCVHCEQNFSSRGALEIHKSAHKNDIVICKICDMAIPLEHYEEHQKSHFLHARTETENERKILESKETSISVLKNQNTISGLENDVETNLEEIICEREVNVDGSRSEDNEKSSVTIQQLSEEKLKRDIQKKDPCFYKCTNCLRIFKDRGTILKHMQRIHPLVWVNERSLLAAKKLQTEDEKADENEIYMCRICPIDFDNRRNFFKHLETHHHCKFCTKTFYHKEEMKIHLRAHEKPYRCTICDASFYVEKNYLDHKLTHSYNCELCKASYRSMESLMNHKKVSHPKISCAICLQIFDSPDLLSKHETIHKKKKSSCLCELCGKSYSNATRFNYHMLSHTADSDFSCKFCPMSFKSGAKLRSHQRFSHLFDYTESLRESLDSELNK